jgi:hypothetical protein
MKGLSKDIEIAVQTVIDGLNYPIVLDEIEQEKLKTIVQAKVNSFKYGKELLLRWQNSFNAPSEKTIKSYVQKLVKSGDSALKVLREALRQNIDYSTIDPTKHHLAIAAKPMIHQSIVELDAALIELRLQLSSENINLKEQEFKRGYPERFANGEMFPMSDYYKEWYCESKDAIMLDPKGTKGDVIKLGDIKVMLPAVPHKKDILFSDLPKSEQYWRRTPMPSGLNQESEDSYVEYIVEEFRRRREGIWFMNNGKPVYLTGTHYFAMQWVKMEDDGGYMNFRYAQRDMFYFTQACIVDPRCLGELFVKSRRTGFTYQILCQLLNDSTSTSNARIGMTSKSDEDAKMAFSKFKYGFLNLPFFFKPVVKGAEDSKNFLEFAKPPDRTKTAKKRKDTNTDDYLNSYIDYQPTKDSAYDGQKMYRYLGDECFGKGTKILMSDMSFKNIEDIKVGDYVIVEGGKTMRVKRTGSGYDDLYIVKQPYGKDYIVNSRHRLYFKKGKNKDNKKFITITAPEFMSQSYFNRRITNGVKFSGIEFEEKQFVIDPYILGCWIGDGNSSRFNLLVNHNKDQEIIDEFKLFAKKVSCDFNIRKRTDNETTSYISLIQPQKSNKTSRLNTELKRLNLINNKHIPKEYFFSSQEQRLELLAGIIDTDGYLSKSSYVIGMSKKHIIEEVYHLAKSCGLDVSEVFKKRSNFDTDVYVVRITKSSRIKCRINRKKSESTKFYNSRRSKIDVQYYSFGEYYGIELDADNDNDRRLILDDYTVSMNCSKWDRGVNYENHWGQISPTFDNGGRIVGKALIGSTVNAMKKGGQEFYNLYMQSNAKKRDNVTGRTASGLYSYFLPAHKNMEQFTDKYGVCHESLNKGETFVNAHGEKMSIGAVQFLEARRAAKKRESDIAYNEELRAFPMKIEEAFRDELKQALFNVERIIQQLEYNEFAEEKNQLVRGNFMWSGGIKDTKVEWHPNENGRFLVSWIPPDHVANRNETKMGMFGGYSKHPSNDYGCFGCDPYDISGVVEGVRKDGSYNENTSRASKGSLHGVTSFSIGNIPSNAFFLEYIERPKTAEIFFEDVLMACVFYGLPILAENNKPRLLYHFKNRGYRGFVITRPDKASNRLSPTEKEIGGIPNNSEDVKQMHASAIEAYIEKYVGLNEETQEHGYMPFNRTLNDWKHFDISNRTKFDAAISSGLALMGVNRHLYKTEQERKVITVKLKTYGNK